METRQDYLTVLSVTDTYCYWREGDERGDQEVYFRILSREDEQAFDDLASATIS